MRRPPVVVQLACFTLMIIALCTATIAGHWDRGAFLMAESVFCWLFTMRDNKEAGQ